MNPNPILMHIFDRNYSSIKAYQQGGWKADNDEDR